MATTRLLNFPEFIPLDLGHKKIVKHISEPFQHYSDFNFASLFSWNTYGITGISSLHNNLVIRFTDYNDDSSFLTFLGTNELAKTLEEIFNYCKSKGLEENLKLIGQEVIDAIPDSIRKEYLIKEDRDNHDYILSVQDLCDFKTTGFGRRRSSHDRFVRDYGQHVVCSVLDLEIEVIQKQIEEVMKSWQHSRGRPSHEVHNEFVAIGRALKYPRELGIRGFGVYAHGKLIGFALFEMLSEKMSVGHFLKANTDYIGVFEYLMHNLALHLRDLGVEFINIEQDLGIEGLRRYKESYKPVDFLKKYTVSKKEEHHG